MSLYTALILSNLLVIAVVAALFWNLGWREGRIDGWLEHECLIESNCHEQEATETVACGERLVDFTDAGHEVWAVEAEVVGQRVEVVEVRRGSLSQPPKSPAGEMGGAA